MRRLSLNEMLAVFVFILITAVTAVVIHPVYKKMNGIVTAYAGNLCSTIESKTGLLVSYEDLSPSVFTGLRVRNIVLSDSSDEIPVAKINNAVFRYNFFDLLRGRGLSFIKDLTIDGLYFELDESGDNLLLERFGEMAGKRAEKAKKIEKQKKISLADIENIISAAPFNIFIKNANGKYSASDFSIDVKLKKLIFNFIRNENQTSVKTQGNVLLNRGGKNISGVFSADGVIPEQLDGLSIIFRFSECNYDIYELNRLSFLVDYGNMVLNFRTVQNSLPLFVSGFYNMNEKSASVFVKTQDLRGKNFISQKSNSENIRFKNLSVNIGADCKYNFATKTMNYQSSGTVKVPDELFSEGALIAYDVKGNEKSFEVNNFTATGNNVDAEFHGSCIYSGLKISGAFELRKLCLKNGKEISTEVYIDPGKTGFMAFAPQLVLGNKTLTALQLNVSTSDQNIFYDFEMSDYEHMEADNPGIVKAVGIVSSDYKEFECNVSTEQVYLDSIAKTASFFDKSDKMSDFAFLKNYVLSAETFVSFKTTEDSVTCNIPYAVVANIEKDNQFIYFSGDGTKYSMNISRFDYISDGRLVHSSGYMNTLDFNEISFGLDVISDSIPYSFSGNYISGALSVIGDYGFTLVVQNDSSSNKISGSLLTENLPFFAAKSIFSLDTDCDFSYSPEKGFDIRLNRVECREAVEKYSFNPKVVFTGFITRYGIFLENLFYSDKFSMLEGKSNLLWNINDGMFSSASLEFAIKNPLSAEEIKLNAEVANNENVPFSMTNLKEKFYISVQAVINSFGMNRFSAEHSANNSLTASVVASGTLENPYVGMEISSLSLMEAGFPVVLSGSGYIEEKNLIVEKSSLHYNEIDVKNITANFNLNDFSGTASAELDAVVMKKNVHVPIKVSVSDTMKTKGKLLPEEYAVNIDCEKISGSFFTKKVPFRMSILHTAEATFIQTGEEQGISGTVIDGQFVNFSVAEHKPVQFNLTGSISDTDINLNLSNVKVEAEKLLSFVDIPKLKVYRGLIRSSIKIKGIKSDPDFSGSVSIEDADFTLPGIVSQHITFPKALMILNHNRLEMPEIKAMVKKELPVFANLSVEFERWRFGHLDSHIYTPVQSYIPGNFEIRLAKFVGQAALDLDLHFEDKYLDVTGKVDLKNMSINVKLKEIPNAPPKRKIFVRSDLLIGFGQHVTFAIEPLIRAVLIPDSGFGFKYDMSDANLSLDGDLQLRSGDISYLSRSFYLKNGTLKFNRKETEFNPIITVQAETRERDDDGKEIRIILSANNQYLSDFNPKFSSIPAKSEAEIMSLLGQIAVGDSDNMTSLLFAAGDYAVQSTIGRSIENKLRDFLNFDILSVRTNVLQNALNYNFNKNNQDSSYGIGNFFDNSTVYLGKYLGRSLYVDTLMHWSYDESRMDDKYAFDGLIFKPEIGLEIESPFVNVRWNMAPDFSGLRSDSFVYSTSVTLSWKFSF